MLQKITAFTLCLVIFIIGLMAQENKKPFKSSKYNSKCKELKYELLSEKREENINFSSIDDKANYCFYNNDKLILENKLMRYKEYYDNNKLNVRRDFFRVDSMNFFFTEYDTFQNKITEGLVRINKSKTVILNDTVPTYDLDGNLIKYGIQHRSSQQLVKSGNYFEKKDGSFYCGNYNNNEKANKWYEYSTYSNYLKNIPERVISYNNNIIEKIDTINQALKSYLNDSLFCKNWKMDHNTFSNAEFGVRGNDDWVFKKDKTFKNTYTGSVFSSYEGTWSIEKNILTLKIEKRWVKWKIKYLSDKYIEFIKLSMCNLRVSN